MTSVSENSAKMINDIGYTDYFKLFKTDNNPFISRNFIAINEHKVEKVLYLCEDKEKPTLGIVVGLNNRKLYSPFSAPFGGFHFTHDTIYISTICDFLVQLKEFLIANEFEEIVITLPPCIYHHTINSKIIHCLFQKKFNLEKIDLTSWIDLGKYDNFFNDSSTRNHLNQAIKSNLLFCKISESDISEKKKVYELIRLNRLRNERPIYMSFEDILKVNSVWDIDYFAVYGPNNELLAGSINYLFHPQIVYGVFWADNELGRSLRAMDFCIYNLSNHYKMKGYKYFDIGISTEQGVPNEGLLRFKETHESTTSLRYTFKWENLSPSSANRSIEVVEPIYRYGIVLRLVDENDAEFIYKLRNNDELNKFISYTSPFVEDQIDWIRSYKEREKAGLEYYFIAEDQLGNRYGTIRLYHFEEESFEIGSWLFYPNSPMGMAVKAHFIGFEIGFEMLKAEFARFDIRKKNSAVLRYMKDFEMVLVKEDELNYYFTLSKEKFYERRRKIPIFNSKKE